MTPPAPRPTPRSLPTQRTSSGLDAAIAARSHHPSIPWRPAGDEHRHLRGDHGDRTRCGLAGPLEVAPRGTPFCPDCFPHPPVLAARVD